MAPMIWPLQAELLIQMKMENGKMGGKKGTFEARQTVIMSDIVHRFSRELTLLFASQDASSERCKSTATALFNLL